MKFELLFQKVELRANNDNEEMTVSGYVNKTGEYSEVLGSGTKFVEKIAPGAFTRAIARNPDDIDFLAEHQNKYILASTRNGSLHLSEDAVGLYMEATITPTTWGHDYYQLISSGILRNMSFGFRTLQDSWELRDDGIYERTIEDLELVEVSVVRDPAYSQSTISARGIDVIEEVKIPEELEEEKRNMDEIKKVLESLEQRFADLTKSFEEFRSEQKEREERELEDQTQQDSDPKEVESAKEDPKESEAEEQPQQDDKDQQIPADEPKETEKVENQQEDDDKQDGDQDQKEQKVIEDQKPEDRDKEENRSKISEELSELRNKLTVLFK